MDIVKKLRGAGFGAEDATLRNVLALEEEAGEVVGAYRRWSGMARRTGTAEDLHAEIADVVITTYVTAEDLGVDLDKEIDTATRLGLGVRGDQVERLVPSLFSQVGSVGDGYLDWGDRPGFAEEIGLTLGCVVLCARAIASALGIDLDEVMRAKLSVVYTRGWRDRGESHV